MKRGLAIAVGSEIKQTIYCESTSQYFLFTKIPLYYKPVCVCWYNLIMAESNLFEDITENQTCINISLSQGCSY